MTEFIILLGVATTVFFIAKAIDRLFQNTCAGSSTITTKGHPASARHVMRHTKEFRSPSREADTTHSPGLAGRITPRGSLPEGNPRCTGLCSNWTPQGVLSRRLYTWLIIEGLAQRQA
jgi:hypothetical protein